MTTEVTKTVYVGGFGPETNAQAILNAFSPFGDVIDVQLPPDPARHGPHRGFAFVSYSSATSAYDAIDNMHRNMLPGATTKRILKVNMAKPPKGIALGGSNRAIWSNEDWLKEHGQAPVGQEVVGTEGGASMQDE